MMIKRQPMSVFRARLMMVIVTYICAVGNILAQPVATTLDEIKIAADAGDPVSQDKLAVAYIMRGDSPGGEGWYRKAAEQGYAHSQGQLGHILLTRYRSAMFLKPGDREKLSDDAIKWIIPAANQGDRQGQADLASVYLEGKLIKQDLVEAYKWGDLASQGLSFDVAAITGRSTRDSAILKMNADQITTARNLVAAFTPHQPVKSDLPEPAWVQNIKLSGISGQPDRLFAVINNQTFEKGDQAEIKVGERRISIRCVDIRNKSAVISVDGMDGTRELKMP